MVDEKVATYHLVPGTRNWVETLHDTIEEARAEGKRLIEAGEAAAVRFEHRLYPAKDKPAKVEKAEKVETPAEPAKPEAAPEAPAVPDVPATEAAPTENAGPEGAAPTA